MARSRKTTHPAVEQPRREEILRRLRRVAGQVTGVQNMVSEDRYCGDILVQISAARSALDAVAGMLIEDHTKHCVADALRDGSGPEAIEELIRIIRKFR